MQRLHPLLSCFYTIPTVPTSFFFRYIGGVCLNELTYAGSAHFSVSRRQINYVSNMGDDVTLLARQQSWFQGNVFIDLYNVCKAAKAA